MKLNIFTQTIALFFAVSFASVSVAQDHNHRDLPAEETKTAVGRMPEFVQPAQREYSPGLGVWVERFAAYGGNSGAAKIVLVDRGSQAQQWGFEVGDTIFTLAGKSTSTANELDAAYRQSGKRIRIEYVNVRNGQWESAWVSKQSWTPQPVPVPPVVEEDPVARRLGIAVRQLRNGKMKVIDAGYELGRDMGLRNGDIITGVASVGIPVRPDMPTPDGAILREVRVLRPNFGEFTIDVRQFGTIIY